MPTYALHHLRILMLVAGYTTIMLSMSSSLLAAEPDDKTCLAYIEADVVYEDARNKAWAKLEAERSALYSAAYERARIAFANPGDQEIREADGVRLIKNHPILYPPGQPEKAMKARADAASSIDRAPEARNEYERSKAAARKIYNMKIERAKKSKDEAENNATSAYNSAMLRADTAYEAAMRQPKLAYEAAQERVKVAYDNWLRVNRTISPLTRKLFLARRSKREEIRRKIEQAEAEEKRLSRIRYSIGDAAQKALEDADKRARENMYTKKSAARSVRNAASAQASAVFNEARSRASAEYKSQLAEAEAAYIEAKARARTARMKPLDNLKAARDEAYRDAYRGPKSDNAAVMRRLIEGQRKRCAVLYEAG